MHLETQHPLLFMTLDGVVQPTRTTQGRCNSAASFQACVEPCFSALRPNLLASLDDFALFHTSKEDLLCLLDIFLHLATENFLFILLRKFTFRASKMKWCGRLIYCDGVTMNPFRYEGKNMRVSQEQPPNYASMYILLHGCIYQFPRLQSGPPPCTVYLKPHAKTLHGKLREPLQA